MMLDKFYNACPVCSTFFVAIHEECFSNEVGHINMDHRRWEILYDFSRLRIKGDVVRECCVTFGFYSDPRWCLPVEQVGQPEIGTEGIISRANLRAEKDALRVVIKDLERHGVAAVRCDANKVSKGFTRFTRERRVRYSVEDRLEPVKTEKGTNVNGNSEKD